MAFVLLSAITGFILHYHFVAETRANYPNTIGLAKFFGFFTGTMFLVRLRGGKIPGQENTVFL